MIPPHDHADVASADAMRALVRSRRRFFVPAWTAFLAAAAMFFGFAALIPRLFGVLLLPGLPVGAVLCVLYTALIFTLAYLYQKRAARWDELVAELRTEQQQRHEEASCRVDSTSPRSWSAPPSSA